MKVVITGGLGFIGLNLARRLVERGTLTGPSGEQEAIDAITLFDMAAPAAMPAGLDGRAAIVTGDISAPDTVGALIDRDDISVFHLASVVSAGAEKDFDLALRVNLKGGRNVFEACRRRAGAPRVVFASSYAVFGPPAAPPRVSDTTKPTPATTYGMTKAMGELMINDYTRKGYIDGRAARLPTVIIRPGRPNAAASSFASGVLREPLAGEECILPVDPATEMAVIGHRACIAGFIALHEADGGALGADRGVNFPGVSTTVAAMMEALERAAADHGRRLGPITVRPDAAIQAIVAGWPTAMVADRALALGLPASAGIAAIIDDYIEDFAGD